MGSASEQLERAGPRSPPSSVGVGSPDQPQAFVAFPTTRLLRRQHLGSVWRVGGTADAKSVLRSGRVLLHTGIRGINQARR